MSTSLRGDVMNLFKILFFFALFNSGGGYSSEPACVRELEEVFFNPYYVSQALSLHDVSQSAWAEVNRVLKQKAQNVPALVREKAKAMDPNPFDVPYDPDGASKVLKEVLYGVFAETLTQFNITDPYEVKEMFAYLLERQADKWTSCFGVEDSKKE